MLIYNYIKNIPKLILNMTFYLVKNFLNSTILILILSTSLYAETTNIEKSIWFDIQSKENFQHKKNSIGFNFNYNFSNLETNITPSVYSNKKIIFDNSYLNYNVQNISFGFGKIARLWSFSPNTSLFLSSNARPAKSVYFKINNIKPFKKNHFSLLIPTSIEMYNSFLKNSSSPKNSMMLGTRAIFTPTQNFSVEVIKISQWGGRSNNVGIKDFMNAIAGNTNEGKYEDINQVAGIGFSYTKKNKFYPFRFYGQTLGEDEAGNLPSCLMYLIGIEGGNHKNKLISNIGLEFIDTRINLSSNGHCGPNTGYNNQFHKYTNYDVVMGAPIDTEGKSIKIWGASKLSSNSTLKYVIEYFTINDTSWPGHRLTTTKETGWEKSLRITHKLNKITFGGKINYGSILLNKGSISNNLSIGAFASAEF